MMTAESMLSKRPVLRFTVVLFFLFSCLKFLPEFFPQTCSHLTPFHGVDASGVYKIYPFGNSTGLMVYCDLKTAGGGWLVRK